jgi:hypothetical protein
MNIVVIIISGILGATVTFYISDKLKQSVRSSALLSLIVALFSFFPEILNACQKKIPLVFIGTSFIGMVSSKVQGYFRLAVAGILLVFTSTVISFKVSVERRDFSFYFFTHNYAFFDFILRSTKIKRILKIRKFFESKTLSSITFRFLDYLKEKKVFNLNFIVNMKKANIVLLPVYLLPSENKNQVCKGKID